MTSAAVRRCLHASTAALLVLPALWGWPATRWILAGLLAAALALETARLSSRPFREWLAGKVPVFRPHEHGRPSGAFWLLVAHAGVVWFPPQAAVVAVLCAAWADPAASWVGSASGSAGSKTLAGSAAALVTAAAVAAWGGLGWWQAGTLGASVALAERFSGRLDDNLLVGPVAGVVTLLLAGGA